MFTGLIETIGIIAGMSQKRDVVEVRVNAPKITSQLHIGDSVSISGVCTTVTSYESNSFTVELMPETMKRTKFSTFRTGSHVNLERAMRADSRLDGHIVAGHIDGTGILKKTEIFGMTKKLYFSAPDVILSCIVEKGSITIDGVSLTVIDTDDDFFSVGVIPTTLAETTIGSLTEGSLVNLETDIIGKYVIKYLNNQKKSVKVMKNSLTWDKLSEYGWNSF